MTRSRPLSSTLLLAALVIGCTTSDAGNDTDASTSTSTGNATNPSGSQSGSVTSAPGSATDGMGSDSTPTMATASTTTSGTSDGSATTEPCSFLNCDDMNVMNECDTWAQDCPEGQKCTPYIADGGGGWNVAKCVDVIGTDKPGDECTSEGAASGIDTCIEGVMCWGVDMNGNGTCVSMCSGSPDAPFCEEGFCTIAAEGVLHLCFRDCDPLLQDCTVNGDVCYPIADGFTCAPDASGDEGQANDPCEFINVCDKGLMCAEAESVGTGCMPGATGCCTPFCPFPDGPCPNPDQQCVQYFDPALFPENDPLLDIGFCGVPG
jgi:hypothetical protein